MEVLDTYSMTRSHDWRDLGQEGRGKIFLSLKEILMLVTCGNILTGMKRAQCTVLIIYVQNQIYNDYSFNRSSFVLNSKTVLSGAVCLFLYRQKEHFYFAKRKNISWLKALEYNFGVIITLKNTD